MTLRIMPLPRLRTRMTNLCVSSLMMARLPAVLAVRPLLSQLHESSSAGSSNSAVVAIR